MGYGRVDNHGRHVINARGERLARMLSTRVAEGNRARRAGLQMASEGLVQAVDVLRSFCQWTAAGALIEFYGFSEKEFNEAEYAADRMAS